MNDLQERLNLALGQDPSIVTTPEEAHTHLGNTTEYLVSIGLEKRDLKKLERHGLAIRARTYNGQQEYTDIKDKQGFATGLVGVNSNFMEGSKIKWILLARSPQK